MNFIRKNFRLISFIGLALVTLVTVLSLLELRKTRFDYDFESFFPTHDPDLEVYQKFRKTFGYDNEFILLAIENKKGIFRQDFLAKVETLTDTITHLADVTSVLSPTNLQSPRFTELGVPLSVPYLHVDEPDRYASDSTTIYQSEELVGSFFAPDAKSVSIFIQNTEGIHKKQSDTLINAISRLVAAQHFDKVHIASKANGQKVYLERLTHEFFIFFVSSFFLIVLFLYVSFRSFWGVWVPIVIVVISIIWVLALMTACGKALDIMTVLLPTMMFVVGMSDVVHIVTKYLEELRHGYTNRFDALVKTIKDVGFATFITLITTGLGFLTLLNSRIIPIRDFGLYTSLGVFVAFILAFTIMPIVLNVIREPNLKLEHESSQFWNKKLQRLLLWIFRNGKMIAAGTIVLTLLSIYGITRIQLNNYLIEGLTTKDELREDFNFFEKHFAGVRPFEMIVTPADSLHDSILSMKELQAMDKLETYLKKNYGVGFIVSPATLVKSGNKAHHNGNPEYFQIPNDSEDVVMITSELSHLRRMKKHSRIYPDLKPYFTKNARQGRISGKMRDLGSLVIRQRNRDLENFMATDPDMKALHAKVTGAAVMLDKNNEYLVNNTMQGLIVSILVVGLIIGIIHKSWRMAIIAVVPNLLPIVFIGGLMGFAGIDLKSSTSIIFSIAFGIATDDTVHFLGRLKLEQLKGKRVLYALKRTYISTGKAVVVTSLILSAGFMTLIASGFESTFLFGLLVSVTLLIAVLTDLLLFPLLVMWLIKDRKVKD